MQALPRAFEGASLDVRWLATPERGPDGVAQTFPAACEARTGPHAVCNFQAMRALRSKRLPAPGFPKCCYPGSRSASARAPARIIRTIRLSSSINSASRSRGASMAVAPIANTSRVMARATARG